MRRKKKSSTARTAGLAAVAAALAAGIAAVLGRRRAPTAGTARALSGRFRRRARQPTYSCECGQRYRITGMDRHRVYWPADAPEDQPVLGDACVKCERPLPAGHDAPVAA